MNEDWWLCPPKAIMTLLDMKPHGDWKLNQIASLKNYAHTNKNGFNRSKQFSEYKRKRFCGQTEQILIEGNIPLQSATKQLDTVLSAPFRAPQSPPPSTHRCSTPSAEKPPLAAVPPPPAGELRPSFADPPP